MKTLTEQLEEQVSTEVQEKWKDLFAQQCRYCGLDFWSAPGINTELLSTDRRELFLMFCMAREYVKIPEEKEK